MKKAVREIIMNGLCFSIYLSFKKLRVVTLVYYRNQFVP